MAFCVDCCFPEDPNEDGQQLALTINESEEKLQPSPKEIAENRRHKIKLINGQIPSNLPAPNSADWDATKMLKQAGFDAIKQRTNKIDPNYQHFKSNPKYNVMFEEKFNHGLYKISKNYYIITETDKVHRLTVETWLNDGAPQRIYLNSEVILSNRGPSMDIIWHAQKCSPIITNTDNSIIWTALNLAIEGRLYILRPVRPSYPRKSDAQQDNYYFMDKPVKSAAFTLAKIWLTLLRSSKQNEQAPPFTLSTTPWDEKTLGPAPQKINLDKWTCEIDTKTVVNTQWGFWNFMMVLVDIPLFLPALLISLVLIYVWLFKACCTCNFPGCCQQNQKEEEYEPESVTFDLKQAVQYFKAIHSSS